jgi:hypothetical protein
MQCVPEREEDALRLCARTAACSLSNPCTWWGFGRFQGVVSRSTRPHPSSRHVCLRPIARLHVLNRIPSCDDMHNVGHYERWYPTPMAPGSWLLASTHHLTQVRCRLYWMDPCRLQAAPLSPVRRRFRSSSPQSHTFPSFPPFQTDYNTGLEMCCGVAGVVVVVVVVSAAAAVVSLSFLQGQLTTQGERATTAKDCHQQASQAAPPKIGANSLLACLLRHCRCISDVLPSTHSCSVALVNTPDSVSRHAALCAFHGTRSLASMSQEGHCTRSCLFTRPSSCSCFWPGSSALLACVCTSVTPFLSTCPRARAPCASTPPTLLPPLSLAIVCTHQTLVSFLGVGYLSIALAQLPPLVYRFHIAPCISLTLSLPRPLPLPLPPARFASIATATDTKRQNNKPPAKPWPRRHSGPQPRKHPRLRLRLRPRPRQRPRPRRPLFGAPSLRAALISAYSS